MGLKLMLESGDKVVMDSGIVVDVLATGRKVQLEVHAPSDVAVNAVFKDSR